MLVLQVADCHISGTFQRYGFHPSRSKQLPPSRFPPATFRAALTVTAPARHVSGSFHRHGFRPPRSKQCPPSRFPPAAAQAAFSVTVSARHVSGSLHRHGFHRTKAAAKVMAMTKSRQKQTAVVGRAGPSLGLADGRADRGGWFLGDGGSSPLPRVPALWIF